MAVYGELNRIVMKKKRSAKDKRRVRLRNSGRTILGVETNNTNKMDEEKKDPVTEEVKPEGVAEEKVEGVE